MTDYPAGMTSAGQRAAHTRAANKAAGITPGGRAATPGGQAAPSDRAAGLTLALILTHHTDRLTLAFLPLDHAGQPFPGGLGAAEAGLPSLAWHARPDYAGGLLGHQAASISLLRAGAATLEAALPLMRRADRLLALAMAESEDGSLAFCAATLAAHFRAGLLIVRQLDGAETQHKRGAAYVTAHKAEQAFLAAQPIPADPAASTDPTPAQVVDPAPDGDTGQDMADAA